MLKNTTFAFHFFFFFEKSISFALWVLCKKRKQNYAFLVGPVHCSRDTQVLYAGKKNFKTRSHSTIHIFKNYFVTMFSVFSKISGIQTDPYIAKSNCYVYNIFIINLL